MVLGEVGEHAELVAGEARHHVAIAQHAADAFGDDLQQFVARVVAEGIVDPLEVIEVEEHHRQALASQATVLQVLDEHFVECRAVLQAGQAVVASHLAQRGVGVVELVEQGVDPAVFAEPALPLFLRPCGPDAAGGDGAGEHSGEPAQAQRVGAGLQFQRRAGGYAEHQRSHPGEMHGDDGAGQQQAGDQFHVAVARAAPAAQVGDRGEGGEGGADGDQYRKGEQRWLVVLGGHRAHRRHPGVVHGGDAQADAAGGEQAGQQAEARAGGHVHRQVRGGDGDQQRQAGDRQVVAQGDRRVEREHGDEMRGPDAAAQAERPDPLPAARVAQAVADPLDHVQRRVPGEAGDEEGERHQRRRIGAVLQHVAVDGRLSEEAQALPVHSGVSLDTENPRTRARAGDGGGIVLPV